MLSSGQVNPRTPIPSRISGVNSKERLGRLFVKIKINFGILSKEPGTTFQLEHVHARTNRESLAINGGYTGY